MKKRTLAITIIVAMLCGMAGAGGILDTPPFPYQLPDGAPPLLNWYVCNQGQQVIFNINASTRYGSPINFIIEDAVPDTNAPLNLVWTRVYSGPIDPNMLEKGWVDKYVISMNVPANADFIFLKATASIVVDAATFGWHDLRADQSPIELTISRTIMLKAIVEGEDPPILWDRDPPILSDAQKVWQKAFAMSQKNGTPPPSKPVKVLE